MKPSETKKNITSIINDYSQEFGIAPQFVEKDYYVIKILSEISKINYPDLKIVFSRVYFWKLDYIKYRVWNKFFYR